MISASNALFSLLALNEEPSLRIESFAMINLHSVSDLLEQPLNRSDNAIKLITKWLQAVNNLFQTCYDRPGASSVNTTC